MFTGKKAQAKVGAPGKGLKNKYADKKKWQAFVQSRGTGTRHLHCNTDLLYAVRALLCAN